VNYAIAKNPPNGFTDKWIYSTVLYVMVIETNKSLAHIREIKSFV
jgi:hypothetical protein